LPGGDKLSVVFERVTDRYQHTILYSGQPLLRSVEGSASDPWPASPPLQSLSLETLPDGRRVALLVGMAGRGHWSASVEADQAGGAFAFDIACRSPALQGMLDSRYAILTGDTSSTCALSPTEARIGLGSVTVVVASSHEGDAACELSVDDNGLVIQCQTAKEAAVGPTYRWRYRVGIELRVPTAG
jgi:hypothetical protein